MVGKNFNIFNFKSQPSLNLEKVNSDNNNILIIGLNHNNNQIIIAYYLVNFKRVILFSSYVQVSFISIGLKLKKPNYLSILTRNYSSMNVVLHPAWVTGFTDAEGSFILTITKKTKLNVGWAVRLIFTIGLHEKDLPILQSLKNLFTVGSIIKLGEKTFVYRVESQNDVITIIYHFDKFKLVTQKAVDYELWKQVFQLMERREHLTMEGLHKILAIKASMNWGLSDKLKLEFTNILPVERPKLINIKIQDRHWFIYDDANSNIKFFTQKGIYIWQSVDGKNIYVDHSINLYNRISSFVLSP